MAYNHYVTFERQVATVDTAGQQSQTWEEIGQAWTTIAPISGRNYFAASGEKANITHEIETRFQTIGVRARDRVRYGSRYFDVHSAINKDERNRTMILRCVEAVHTI